MTSKRLDQVLVELGHFETRARARDAVLRGTVYLDGAPAKKASQKVPDPKQISVRDPAARYVSRAALKLIAGLDHFAVDPKDRICLDIGASTGGFTQVLLERGAQRVHAIDVGHDQLHSTLRSQPKVSVREKLNARDLTSADLEGDTPGLIVSDVSFISLKLALPPALDLAAPGAEAVLLVKPQFEAGRDKIGKGGLVDPAIAEEVAETLRTWLEALPGWNTAPLIPSPVLGGDGNKEWLLYGKKTL